MKKIIPIIVFFFAINTFSQFSRIHYIPPVSAAAVVEPQGQYMYISCPSSTPINFKIKAIGGAVTLGTVSRDLPYIFYIGTGYNTQMIINQASVNTIKNNKGYIVEADNLVYVTVRMTATPLSYHAGSIVSKGLAALGRQFRIGAFENIFAPSTTTSHYTFATILATANNTTISFGSIKPGVQLINNAAALNNPSNIVLNQGESFAMAVQGPLAANKNGLIGASITSDKDIVVNCGSFAGSNSNTANLDIGMDQIVSAERTGTKYIFIKGGGINVTERPMIVADQNGTEVFVNGNSTPIITLSAGEYKSFDGTDFSVNKNLFIETSKPAFAYQGIGSALDPANQNMAFVPPLSCGTPKVINNIPLINQIGGLSNFTGAVNIVTEVGSTLTFIVNGTNYTLASLSAIAAVSGPLSVPGNSQYETYIFTGLTGNISVFSTSQVYLSYYGYSGFATYGGFYSGFTFDPEISFISPPSATGLGCVGSVNLEVSALSAFDNFQWFKNGIAQTTATSNSYTPTSPGYYFVRGKITACGTANLPFDSVEIPVSECPIDSDNDGVNNNIDIDLNNDGITNCAQSNGNLAINTTVATAGVVNINAYSNSYTGLVTNNPATSLGTFTGNVNSFVTQVPAGKGNKITYKTDFLKPISLSLEYVTTANAANLLNSDSNFTVNCSQNNTITVINPTNQLLIDTNYDGTYETGVTKFSSFEIRFRVNSTAPLAAGTGDFSFRINNTTSFSITHENLLEFNANNATFSLIATCVPKDLDLDGTPDQNDLDADNDGIPNFIENLGNFYATNINSLFVDLDKNGLSDFFEQNVVNLDFDGDGIQNYLDLDSDNDGIYDLVESGSNAIDANLDGIIDGNAASFGTNGLSSSLQNTANSGVVNYLLTISNAANIPNFMNSDSDADGCSDVLEAGFLDPNSDKFLGNVVPPSTNPNGLVTSGAGYTALINNNYTIAAPMTITTQPANATSCELDGTTFTINTIVDGFQWQVSTDNGLTFNNITNNSIYSGANLQTLTLSNIPLTYNNYLYRVILSKSGNSCGLTSANAVLTVNAKPILTVITIKQCDNDLDGLTDINLLDRNNDISSNASNQTFSYFTTLTGANTNDATVKVPNPVVFNSGTGTVWVRVVENASQCFSVVQMNILVSVTQLPANFIQKINKCDDYLDPLNNDKDGITKFDFSAEDAFIRGLLTTFSYTLKYYRNPSDASAEINEITDIVNYRNIGYPNFQEIIGRIDSNLDNSCFGFARINLNVEKLPIINKVNTLDVLRYCDDDQDGILAVDTSAFEAVLIGTQTGVSVIYTDGLGNPLSSPLPNPLSVNLTQTIKVKVVNNVTATNLKSCFEDYSFDIVVDKLPIATAINPNDLIKCDDEVDPSLQDGKFPFDTSTFESTILNGQTGMTVKYTDAAGLDFYPMPNPFSTTTQNIMVTVLNPLNPTCFKKTTLAFIVNSRPKINLLGDELICSNLPLLTKTLDAAIIDGSPTTNYNFIWKKDGVLLTNTNPTLAVNQGGVYTVTVINKLTLCENTRTITVYASDVATLLPPTITDLTENNVAIINVSPSSPGKYEYSLDDINGPYQESNVFDNIPIGIHEVFVNDVYNCGVVKQQLNIIGAPKFFTPNNDGYNDYWNVKGLDLTINYNSTVTIFDRYGKLIKKFDTSSQGWDGSFNNQILPADDYWFTLELQDGRFTKGHFSLKR